MYYVVPICTRTYISRRDGTPSSLGKDRHETGSSPHGNRHTAEQISPRGIRHTAVHISPRETDDCECGLGTFLQIIDRWHRFPAGRTGPIVPV